MKSKEKEIKKSRSNKKKLKNFMARSAPKSKSLKKKSVSNHYRNILSTHSHNLKTYSKRRHNSSTPELESLTVRKTSPEHIKTNHKFKMKKKNIMKKVRSIDSKQNSLEDFNSKVSYFNTTGGKVNRSKILKIKDKKFIDQANPKFWSNVKLKSRKICTSEYFDISPPLKNFEKSSKLERNYHASLKKRNRKKDDLSYSGIKKSKKNNLNYSLTHKTKTSSRKMQRMRPRASFEPSASSKNLLNLKKRKRKKNLSSKNEERLNTYWTSKEEPTYNLNYERNWNSLLEEKIKEKKRAEIRRKKCLTYSSIQAKKEKSKQITVKNQENLLSQVKVEKSSFDAQVASLSKRNLKKILSSRDGPKSYNIYKLERNEKKSSIQATKNSGNNLTNSFMNYSTSKSEREAKREKKFWINKLRLKGYLKEAIGKGKVKG